MSLDTGIRLAYLIAAVCFIIALSGLSGPKTARAGNLIGAAGMAIAIGMTFATPGLSRFGLMAGAMALGAVIGFPAARLVKMTAIPQMVAAFNGVGGGAAALIALATFLKAPDSGLAVYQVVEVLFGVIIGSVSFSGSIIAFAKLQELVTGRPITYPGQQVMNGVVAVAILGLGVTACVSPHTWLVTAVAVLALLFGIAFVLPIGGADVPVLISLLNSFTGLAVAASGFVLHSVVLVVAGTLVGASGTLLTRMMSSAMGRSLPNILFSAFGSVITATAGTEAGGDRTVRSASAEDIAVLLAYSSKVIIVPGYGLAVAQAQHTARGHLCHPPRRRTHARSYERAPRRSQRPLRPAEGDGRRQPGVPDGRRRPHRRRQRRRQPGRQEFAWQPHLRDAHPGGR
jgi:NAD(P) transhydrogenase subunit beta